MPVALAAPGLTNGLLALLRSEPALVANKAQTPAERMLIRISAGRRQTKTGYTLPFQSNYYGMGSNVHPGDMAADSNSGRGNEEVRKPVIGPKPNATIVSTTTRVNEIKTTEPAKTKIAETEKKRNGANIKRPPASFHTERISLERVRSCLRRFLTNRLQLSGRGPDARRESLQVVL